MILRHPRIIIWASACVCFLAGDSYLRGQQPTPPVAKEETVNSEGAAKVSEIESPIVKITAAESASHKLPPAEIKLNTGKVTMYGAKFSSPDEYFTLSGPPGGPLGLNVTCLRKPPRNAAEWKTFIEKQFADRFPQAGSVDEVKLSDKDRTAFTCTTDKGFARTHHLLILVPVPKSDQALLVDYYYGADESATPTPAEMAKDDIFSEISPSLSIRFE